jgi:hypothetical protein
LRRQAKRGERGATALERSLPNVHVENLSLAERGDEAVERVRRLFLEKAERFRLLLHVFDGRVAGFFEGLLDTEVTGGFDMAHRVLLLEV